MKLTYLGSIPSPRPNHRDLALALTMSYSGPLTPSDIFKKAIYFVSAVWLAATFLLAIR